MYKEVFELRLYARRKELDLSQMDVSRDTEINQSNISKFEAGKLEPNLEALGKLANYYQVSIDWLLGNPHNGREGDVVKTAILEFYNEILNSIKGSDYQAKNRDELLEMLYYNLEKDKDDILKRYSSNREGE